MSKEETCCKDKESTQNEKNCNQQNNHSNEYHEHNHEHENNKKQHCDNHGGHCDNHEHHGGRCKELEAKIESLEKQIEETKKLATGYLSTASYYKSQAEDNKKDFERYKERNKDIEVQAVQKANESVAKKIIPIIDNFDQAMAHITDMEIIKGFSMIYSALVSTLTDVGVVEIACKNKDVLNPEFHNCISAEETDDEALNGLISTIYQKGYMFAESKKVIRPATVSVYKN